MAKKTAVNSTAPNPFALAKASAESNKTPKKNTKGTVIELPIIWETNTKTMTAECARLHQSLQDLIECTAAKKQADGKIATAVGIVKPVVMELYAKQWCNNDGVRPETPVSIVAENGAAVTYVVQNRSGTIPWSEAQQAMLEALLGAKNCENITEDNTNYLFDSEVLQEEGVMAKMAKAINDSDLTPEQKANLVKCQTKTFLKSTMVDNLANLVKHDHVQLVEVFNVLDTVLTNYLKP